MNKSLHYAAIAGIISIILLVPLIIFEVMKVLKVLTGIFLIAYVLLYVLAAVLDLIFTWGFVIIGKKAKIRLLINTSYILIVSSILYTAYIIPSFLFPALEKYNLIVTIFTLLLLGAVGLAFSIALLRLKKLFPIANVAGILGIIMSASFLTIIFSFIGLLLIVPFYIVTTMLLFRAAKKF